MSIPQQSQRSLLVNVYLAWGGRSPHWPRTRRITPDRSNLAMRTSCSSRKPKSIQTSDPEQRKLCGKIRSQADKQSEPEAEFFPPRWKTNKYKPNVAMAGLSACTLIGYRHWFSLETRMSNPPVLQEPEPKPRARRPERTSRWVLTKESIDKLLSHLGEDHETAGRAYQELRAKLIVFFECNRCTEAEELADIALNRVARKLCDGENIHKPMLYALSVARFVLNEYWRRPEKSDVSLDETILEFENNYSAYVENARARHEAEMRREECMRRCFMQLPAQQRNLLTDYYCCEKGSLVDHRREMAERLRISPNALSIQVHRLRGKLINTLEESLKRD